METEYINLTAENLDTEHLCCAIADKKHQCGVTEKKIWLKDRMKEGHVFRKLDVKAKVFIEYAPLEKAWTPVIGDNYIYIYCLWVSGSYHGKGYGKELLEYCIADAKAQGKSGVCILSSKKKKPFLSERKFLERFGFQAADEINNEYLLMSLTFDGTLPHFTENAKKSEISDNGLTIYYSMQCPYIANCIQQVEDYCKKNDVSLTTVPVDTLEKAKEVPCIFNNWAVFYGGKFVTLHLMNEGYLATLIKEVTQ